MAYKVFIAGILLLSVQTLSAADAVSEADSQTTQPSTEQSGDKPANPKDTPAPDKIPESTDKKPEAEGSEPDCD